MKPEPQPASTTRAESYVPALVLLRSVIWDRERPTQQLAERVVQAAALAMREAAGLGDVSEVRDKLRAVEVFILRRSADLRTANLVAAQRIRTEWEIGRLLLTEVTGGSHVRVLPPGITRHQSSRWQRLAQMTPESLEEKLQHFLEAEDELSTQAMLRVAGMDHNPDDATMPRPRFTVPDGAKAETATDGAGHFFAWYAEERQLVVKDPTGTYLVLASDDVTPESRRLVLTYLGEPSKKPRKPRGRRDLCE
jgi:hypothetical protein